MEKPLQVFCCYAHKDQPYLLELKKHLSAIQVDGLISMHDDLDISARMDREQEISHYLNTAHIILLLISPDFLTPNYSSEMEQALGRHKKGEARVIPVILRPANWQAAPFARLQCLPRNAQPATTWGNRDEAFRNIAQGIRLVCEELLRASPPPPLSKIGIDKVRDGKIVRAENIVLPNRSPHFQARSEDLRQAFGDLIIEKTKDFVGRQFVFDALDTFLLDQENGYFIIEGDPGIGKSALLAQLVKQRGYLHHFNVALQSITKPQQFLSSICAQLISLFHLDDVKEPEDAYKNGAFLNQLLKEASRRLGSDERLVIAIDALDEADITGLKARENVLYLPENLPKGVFIVATTRFKHHIPLLVSNSKLKKLEHDSKENIQDVRLYIQFYLNDEQMNHQLQLWNITSSDFTEKLLTKSEGNFMYLHYVLPAIRAGSFLTGTVDDLPQGLKQYYGFHWAQMKGQYAKAFDTVYKPVVCVLAAAKESVSVDQIAAFTGLEHDQVSQVVKEWREFLHEMKTFDSVPVYRIYHTTFQEFLREEVDPGLRTYHKMIATYYLRLKEE